MPRNQYPAKCYRCGQPVGPGDGVIIVLILPKRGKVFKVEHDECQPRKKGNRQ